MIDLRSISWRFHWAIGRRAPNRWVLTTAVFCSFLMVQALPAIARAPVVAPEPPRKLMKAGPAPEEAGETIDTSLEIDATQARELLMQQLMRAADAGIVTLQPSPAEDASGELRAEQSPQSDDDAEAAGNPAEGSSVENSARPVPAENDGTAEVESSAGQQGDTVIDPAAVSALAERIKFPEGQPVVAASERPSPVAEARKDDAREDADERAAVQKAVCFTRAQLTLPDVLAGQHLAYSIGEQRKALIGEFDAANPEPAIALGKTYLAVGMIHEARSIISEYASDDPLGQFLLDVANVWTGEDVERTGSLFKDECIGVQALWRAFAQARVGEVDDAQKSEISSGAALEELPLHARQVVASELGLVAAKAGDWDSVRRLSAMARRAAFGAGETLGKTHLLEYRLAKWRGDEKEAKEHLAEAASSDTDTATEALLIRAEEALRSEDILNPTHSALRMDLGALARREIGTDLAQRAFELEARLFHRQAGADDTINFLSDAVSFGLLDADHHPEFLSELISKPAYSDVERPLAHLYLEDPARFADAIEQKALRRSLIRSLADQGLPGIAQGLMRGSDLQDTDLAIELASSFIEADEYREAIATLSKSDDGVRQRMILSQAFFRMGDFEKAIATLNDLPEDSVPSKTEKRKIASLRLQAELAGRDFASAYSTALSELSHSDDAELAKQSALIALENGADDIPESAREILLESASDELDQLETIYSINDADLLQDEAEIGELNEMLKQIESSEQAIREILNNG